MSAEELEGNCWSLLGWPADGVLQGVQGQDYHGETSVWEAIELRSWVQLQDFLFPPHPSQEDLTSVSTTVSPLLAWFLLRVFSLAHFFSLILASTVCLLARSMAVWFVFPVYTFSSVGSMALSRNDPMLKISGQLSGQGARGGQMAHFVCLSVGRIGGQAT